MIVRRGFFSHSTLMVLFACPCPVIPGLPVPVSEGVLETGDRGLGVLVFDTSRGCAVSARRVVDLECMSHRARWHTPLLET